MTTIAAVHTPAPRNAWQRLMAADPFALVTQSPQWTDVMAASGRWVDASRYYVADDGRELVLPMARRSGVGERSPHASYGEGWGMGGLIAPGGPTADDIHAVLADLAGLPAVATAVRPNPLLAAAWQDAASGRNDLVVLPKRAHVLDLAGGADVVWNTRFGSEARRNARRAERMGVEVVRDTDGSLIPVFYDLLLKSFDRWAERSHEPPWMARSRGKLRDPRRKFEAMARILDDSFRLYVAFYEGRPAATILVLVGANAHYTRGAMDIEVGNKASPNDLLQWVAIREACESGCGSYHMGESGTSTSLAHFKEKFGAQAFDYALYRIERVPLTAADHALRSAVKRVVGFRDA